MNIHLTNTCTWGKCEICFEKLDLKNPTYLDKNKLFNFISDIEPINIGHIGLCGCEPTTHPDINEIIQFLKDNKIHSCLVTNGDNLDKLTAYPDVFSIGIGNNIEENIIINNFLKNRPDNSLIELTITPTEVNKIDKLIEYYTPLCNWINISMLAYWRINPKVKNYITVEYIEKMKELKRRDIGISFFGDIDHIDEFYGKGYAKGTEFHCNAVLNVYPDGHFEYCDLTLFPIEMTIDKYDKEKLVKTWKQKEDCKYCTLKRVAN
jgi:organic radical activating enzyme